VSIQDECSDLEDDIILAMCGESRTAGLLHWIEDQRGGRIKYSALREFCDGLKKDATLDEMLAAMVRVGVSVYDDEVEVDNGSR